ncbi:MAG: ABC transporter permease, partial [Lachnospiraceae bacterium]|nr:ABC transporter permease [Lachnospiraceae bacterium]
MKSINGKQKWDKIIDAGTKRRSLGLKNLYNYRDLIFMFIKKDIIIYYKQTILGPLWFLIQPLISTVIYMFIFGTLADIGTDGVPQILFYYSGTMLWTFFSEILKVANVFNDNKAMFGKVYFPRLVVPFSIVMVNMIKLLIQCALFAILYF